MMSSLHVAFERVKDSRECKRWARMSRVPLAEVAGKLKHVDPASDLVREARALGISFGDEA